MLNNHRKAAEETDMWRKRREQISEVLGRWELQMEKCQNASENGNWLPEVSKKSRSFKEVADGLVRQQEWLLNSDLSGLAHLLQLCEQH